jgi:lysophospholipase L1-like esterase
MACILLFGLLSFSCEEDTVSTPPPSPPNTGSADFTRYVAVGNTLTAGYQSNALSERDQRYSFPAMIMRQLQRTGFEQPLIKNPGIGSRIRLAALSPPTLVYETGVDPTDPASNLNISLPRPYNNLAIPGAILYDILDTTGASSNFISKSIARANPFFAQILRSSLLGNSIYKQAKNYNPTFITVWIGANDVLGYVVSGGRQGTNVLPPSQTMPLEPNFFDAWYRNMLDSLLTTGADIVTANIPDVTILPYCNTVGPQIKPRIPAGISMRYQRNGNPGPAFDGTTFTDPANDPFILLPGMTYAPLLGQPTGKWYRDKGIAPPIGIDTTQPFGFHPQNPWPDALTLDSGERTVAQTAVANFNASIDSIASNRGISVVNTYALLNTIATSGLYISDLGTFSTAFIQGGVFSYDGVHPSTRGYAILANEWIKVINTKFGASIPPITVSSVPGMPIGKVAANAESVPLDYSNIDWKGFLELMAGKAQ